MSDFISPSTGLTFAQNSGALAAGTNSGTVKTTATIAYILDGQFRSKAATDNMSIAYAGPSVYQAPTGVGSVNGSFTGGTNGSTRLYLLMLDAAGALSVLPGNIVDNADLAAGRVALQFPDEPVTACPIGALRVAVTAGTTFTPGSTGLAATGVTSSFINLADVPSAPLTA